MICRASKAIQAKPSTLLVQEATKLRLLLKIASATKRVADISRRGARCMRWKLEFPEQRQTVVSKSRFGTQFLVHLDDGCDLWRLPWSEHTMVRSTPLSPKPGTLGL